MTEHDMSKNWQKSKIQVDPPPPLPQVPLKKKYIIRIQSNNQLYLNTVNGSDIPFDNYKL